MRFSGGITPEVTTPEMWFYQQQVSRHDDLKAVRLQGGVPPAQRDAARLVPLVRPVTLARS